MNAQYYDTHCHLQMGVFDDVDLSKYWDDVSTACVNGTSPKDWERVAQLAERYPEKVIASFGVHPWNVNELDFGWEQQLLNFLARYPNAGVGEVGLDKWVRGYDLERQKKVFLSQVEIAKELSRPLTIHCLKAWGSLRELLPYFRGGRFLLHSYGGPKDYIQEFVDAGAYFSFSPYFLHERKADRLEVFKSIPLGRLLVETDAPSMLGPESTWSTEQKLFSNDQQHPANLFQTYERLKEFLGVKGLHEIVAENFQDFWRV